MEKTSLDAKTLCNALVRARDAALAARQDDDGGSANLDTPTLDLRGVSARAIKEASEISGVRIGEPLSGSYWRGHRFIWTPHEGQGNCRAAMSEAAYQSLRRDLPDRAGHWQQMD